MPGSGADGYNKGQITTLYPTPSTLSMIPSPSHRLCEDPHRGLRALGSHHREQLPVLAAAVHQGYQLTLHPQFQHGPIHGKVEVCWYQITVHLQEAILAALLQLRQASQVDLRFSRAQTDRVQPHILKDLYPT